MKTPVKNILGKNRQRGYILVLSLFFLLLITVIGLYLFRSSTLELRMAGNAAAKAISFENAETAHRRAENSINALADTISTGTAYDCNAQGFGFYATAGQGVNCTVLQQNGIDWDNTDSIEDANNSDSHYVLEYLGLDEVYEIGDDVEIGAGEANTFEVHVFRIVGRGDEPTGAVSTVGTIFLARKS